MQIVLKKRDAENAFREIWSTVIDPDSRAVNPADRRPPESLDRVRERPAVAKVDLLVIGEGYTAAEMHEVPRDVQRLVGTLFATEPFKARKADFNVRALDLPSAKPA